MLNQLTQNRLSRIMLAAGLCLIAVFMNPFDRPVPKTTEKNLNGNGLVLNGTSFNGTNLNGANLNGANLNGTSFNGTSLNGASLNGVSLNGANLNGNDLGANGVHFRRFGLTSSTLTTAVLKQKPIQKIRLEGGQLALKIKRSD